jgi:hypothetical protein
VQLQGQGGYHLLVSFPVAASAFPQEKKFLEKIKIS